MTRTLLFTGDSVTDVGRSRADDTLLGDGYVAEIGVALAGHPLRVVNRGVSGNRVVDLEGRWEEDVVALRPDVLTILIGINDTWRRYDSDDPTSAEDYGAGYRRLLERATAQPVSLLLMEPFVLPVNEHQRAWRDDLDAKIAQVHALGRDFGATVIPLDAFLTARTGGAFDAAAHLAGDGVHPTRAGHELIARLWLECARSNGVVSA